MKKNYFFILFFALLFSPFTYGQVWQDVGSTSAVSAGVAGRQTLVCDQNDDLIVGYYDTSVIDGSVQKYSQVDQSWSYVGGSAGITGAYTTYNSLAVDTDGVIYFSNQAAYPATGQEIRKFENNSWSQLPNVTTTSVNFNTIYVSPDDVLFAANNASNGTVKKYINDSWQQIGATGFTGGVPFFLDMVVSSTGTVYLSFNNNGFLHVYQNDVNASETDTWTPVGGIANLAGAPNTEDYNSSLAIDSEDNVYVAYVSGSSEGNKLNVQKFDGTSWSQIGSANFTANRVKHTSIAVGANDIIYVAVSNWEDEDLLKNYVMAYDPAVGTWGQAGTGYASEGQATYNSLAVDSNGNLFLSFSDSELAALSVKTLNLNVTAVSDIEITPETGLAEITEDNGALQLIATISPNEANQDVIWSIESGEGFATVDNNGLVTAIASNAIVTVKATSVENSSIFDTIEVTITNQDSDVDPISVDVVTATGNFPDIFAVGNTLQLFSTVLPLEADQDVVWSVVNDNGTVTVDQTGLVTGLAEGSDYIRATHIDGTIYGEILVNVWENGCTQGTGAWEFGLGYNITANTLYRGADDFIVEEGMRFEVSKFRFHIITQGNNISNVSLNFLTDDQGTPNDDALYTVVDLVPTSVKYVTDQGLAGSQYEVEVDLPEPLAFTQGNYWVSPQVETASGSSVHWVVIIDYDLGSNYYKITDQNGWVPQEGFDGSFEITGNCTPMDIIVSTINGEDTDIYVGETLQLEAEVTNNQAYSWSIIEGNDHLNINTNTGLVTGISVGEAVARASLVEDESVYHDITINVLDPDECGQFALANDFESAYSFESFSLAVDFTVDSGQEFTVQSITPTVVSYGTNFTFNFYEDNNGLPGSEIGTTSGNIVYDWITGVGFEYYFHRYTVVLDDAFTFTEGTYWVEIQSDALAWEGSTAGTNGYAGAINSGSEWSLNPQGSEYVYQIDGVCTESSLSVSDFDYISLSYYPNPIKDTLTIKAKETIEVIKLYNINGQVILEEEVHSKETSLNTKSLSSGIYLSKVTLVNGATETFKVIKQN
ncbi:Ig-like domain-containing protein [Mangrovimonas futianensis]|uniref:Ig-like domain-containing protein n=1 Tax=Mangrovimonas futianensis TaxID=2895523 RepID=UPI001E301331|nr:Ig-like domain-containing protein [Mangrovimonas futianensis]MCF1422116.1 Ig-like domain-containing protein [Mangrovimonas futianensis]